MLSQLQNMDDLYAAEQPRDGTLRIPPPDYYAK